MESESIRTQFAHYLRRVLTHLYDPSMLRRSPLVELLGADQRRDTIPALRRVLIDAIESQRPDEDSPSDSTNWRIYQILRHRYIEQLPQSRVASDLGLSLRQLQREEKRAREELAEHLWITHDLDSKVSDLSPPLLQAASETLAASAPVPTREQELKWLSQSTTPEPTDVQELMRAVVGTVEPLAESEDVSVEYVSGRNIPRISAPRPILRQALLHTVTTAIRCVPGGQVRIRAEAVPQHVSIHINATGQRTASSSQNMNHADRLEMAQQPAQLAGGIMEFTLGTAPTGSFTVKVLLPASQPNTVLVIDDNADTRHLFERYLSASRYRFVGTADPEEALSLAQTVAPQAIVLDVMMPGSDGWMLLGHLREHPKTSNIPVIVCTILSEEQLALALGAAGFVRKPVGRSEFLSALDRHIGPPPREATS